MRQRFAKDFGGTLRHTPAESGVATSATVTIRRALDGAQMPVPVEAAAATVTPITGELTFPLVAANTPDPRTAGNLYRAVWAYTIGGVTYQADQLFEVNARLLKPVLGLAEVERYLPAAWDELLAGGDAAGEQAIEDGWDDLLSHLAAKGYVADKIMDPERLRQAHRARVIASLYRSFGPDWREAADRAEATAQSELDGLLSSPLWYDANQDAQGDDVTETKVGAVRLTR
jgi:hypothetical protein